MSETSQTKWLLQTDGSVEWRLKSPNIQNPFDSKSSDEMLEEYSSDRSSLMAACAVAAHMDDTIILEITDLAGMEFKTEHPNLVGLSPRDLENFLRESGVWEKLNSDFDKFQDECRAELQRRRG